DFACFPHLELYSGNWHVDNDRLKACRVLRRLHLWHFSPRSKDLSVFANMTRLEELNVIQTNITSLAGVQTLEDLRFLEVGYAPKLTSLDALAGHDLQLRELSLIKAKKIKSYDPIASLRYLRLLRLSDCAPLRNLRWMAGMKRLDSFAFVDTD